MLFLYGSFNREDFVPGRSDLDGGVILNSGVVTDKDLVMNLSKSLFGSFNRVGCDIDVGFNLMDRMTNKDGRFMSYTDDYTKDISREGKVVSGPDYVKEMNGLNYRYSELESISFNLLKVRNDLLKFIYNRNTDIKRANENVDKTFKIAAATPKKLINIKMRNLILDKKKSLDEFCEMFPGFNSGSIERLLELRKDPFNYEIALSDNSFYLDVASSVESMVEEYLKTLPEISDLEVRS